LGAVGRRALRRPCGGVEVGEVVFEDGDDSPLFLQ
jgi:hypothetical protein